MLHVTNGDCAVGPLRAAGVEGDVLPWSEVLHDGPVPAGPDLAALRALRAAFLAPRESAPEDVVAAGMKARDDRLAAAVEGGETVVGWFESDLYDVLGLLQVLARLPDGARVHLVLVGQTRWTSVTEVDPARLAALGRDAPRVDEAQRELARAAWAAFTAPRPDALAPLAAGTPALPAVGHALRRLLEEYPWTRTGLSRTERQLLGALADGARTRREAFVVAAGDEDRPFLGDTSAWDALDRLAPLLDGDTPNARGLSVLAGEEEWTPLRERWIGGVRLPPGRPPWHWDPAGERIVPASSGA